MERARNSDSVTPVEKLNPTSTTDFSYKTLCIVFFGAPCICIWIYVCLQKATSCTHDEGRRPFQVYPQNLIVRHHIKFTWCIWFNISTVWWQDTVKLSPPKVKLDSYKRWMSCRKRWCWTCERGCWPLPPLLVIDLGLLLVIDPTKSSAGTYPPVTQLSDGLWSPSSSDWDLVQLLLSLCNHIWLTCQLTLLPV